MNSSRQRFEVERYSFVRFPPGTTKEQEKTIRWTHNNSLNETFLVFESIFPPKHVQQGCRPLSCLMTLEWGKDVMEKCTVTASLSIVARSPSLAVRYFSASTNMSHRFQVRLRNPADLQVVENIVRDFGCSVKPAGYSVPTPQPTPTQQALQHKPILPNPSAHQDAFREQTAGAFQLRNEPQLERRNSRPDTTRAWDRGFPADIPRSAGVQIPSSEVSMDLPPLRKPTPLNKGYTTMENSRGYQTHGPRSEQNAMAYHPPGQFKRPATAQPEEIHNSKMQRTAARDAFATQNYESQASSNSLANADSLNRPWDHQQNIGNQGLHQEQIFQPRAMPYGVLRPPTVNLETEPSQRPPELRSYASDPSLQHYSIAPSSHTPLTPLTPQSSRPEMHPNRSEPQVHHAYQQHTPKQNYQQPTASPYSTLPTPPPSSSRNALPLQMPTLSHAVEQVVAQAGFSSAAPQGPQGHHSPLTEVPVIPGNIAQKDLEAQIVGLIHDDNFLRLLQQVEGVWQRAGFSLR